MRDNKKKRIIGMSACMMIGPILLAAALSQISRAADVEREAFRSQGRIVFDNGTPDDTADDVIFDAEDIETIGDMVISGKHRIGAELNKYPSISMDLDLIPDFEELAEAVDTLTDDATAESGMILKDQTAYVKGDKLIGSMKDNSGVTVDTAAVSQDDDYIYFDIPEAAYYDEDSKIRTTNSNLGEVYELGTITISSANVATFSATKIPDYDNLTRDDFIVQINSIGSDHGTDKSDISWAQGGITGGTLTKVYDTDSGLLSISGFPMGWLLTDNGSQNCYVPVSVTVYVTTSAIVR